MTCGKPTRRYGEPCARCPGHRGYCRSAYAVENERLARRLRPSYYVPIMRDRARARTILPLLENTR